jgi:hypothetical protein
MVVVLSTFINVSSLNDKSEGWEVTYSFGLNHVKQIIALQLVTDTKAWLCVDAK